MRLTSIQLSAFRLLLSLFIGIITLTEARAQQYFSYSQYMNNLTPLNPAYSLLNKSGTINALIRKQWIGVSGAPSSFILNGSLPIESLNAATGLIVMDDVVGVEHLTEINAFFAKSVQLTESAHLSVSINAGFRKYLANYNGLDPNDPVFKDNISETKPNIGFAVMLYSDKYYVGISLPELTARSLSAGSISNNNYFRNHYNFSAAYLFDLTEDINLKGAGLLTYTRGIPAVGDISGTVYLKKMVGFGLDYRTNAEMAGIMSVNYSTFKFGYSFQFGTSSGNIGRLSSPTHEVTVSYRFGKHSNENKLL